QGGIGGIRTRGRVARLAPVGRRRRRVSRALVVIRDEPVELTGALAALGHEPLGSPTMLIALVASEHTVVGRLMQQMVLERILPHPLERARFTNTNQIPVQKTVEGLGHPRSDALQRLIPEYVADYARL